MRTAIPDSTYRRYSLLLILGAFLFRALYAWFYPVHLVGDEAYYWDWGRRPALGYFSKPPMIAWIYWLVETINGSLFSIRLTPIIFGSLTMWVSYLLASKLFDVRTGFYTVLLGLAVPGLSVLSYLLTIDAPLMLSWSLSLYFFWRYTRGESPKLMLLLLFFSLGAGHLSKQMMVVFPVLAFVYLISGKTTRPLLKTAGPWLSIIGSFLFLIPPYIIWNAQNNWITYAHMRSHAGAPAETTLLATLEERAGEFLAYVGAQGGALSPVIAIIMFMLAVIALFQRKPMTEPIRFLVNFCGIPVVVFLIVAALQKVQPNWPAVAYIAGIILVAAWFSQAIQWYQVSEKARKLLLKIGLISGFALVAFFYFSPMVFSALDMEGNTANPNRRLIGSGRMGIALQEAREQIPEWQDRFIISAGHRYQAAWMGFELPDQPRVYRLSGEKRESQYEVWPGPWNDGQRGKDAILIWSSKKQEPSAQVEKAFESVARVGWVEVKFGTGTTTYTIFDCRNFRAPLVPDYTKH